MKFIFTTLLSAMTALALQAQSFNFPANYNTNFGDVDNPTFAEMNGEIYFFAAKTFFNYEPHKYNCSTGTYTLLKDVNAGGASSEPYNGANEMMKFKNHIYFGALDATGKTDLWRTDGTEAGTVKFKTFAYTSSNPQTITFFAADENLLYFRASIDAGYGIWRTDGTEAGTFLISQATIFNFYVSEKRGETLLHNGKFYFQQKLLPSPISLPYASDGTLAGTVCLVPNGNPDFYYMSEYNFEPFQGKVWFGLDGPTNGGLLRSDGTLAGTQFMGSCGSGAVTGKRPTTLRTAGNYLYVKAYDPVKGYELFYTDGTVNGGGLVAEVRPGGFGGLDGTTEFCAVGNQLFFTASATSGNGKQEVYVANGISGATRLDISGPTEDSKPQFLVSYNNSLYFRATATSSSAANRVYKSDGTEAGTVDAAPGATYFFTGGTLQSLPSGIYFPATVEGNDMRPANLGNCFLTTGTESEVSKTIEVYPNPAQNELTLRGLKGNEKVWLIDFQGRTALEKQMDGIEGKLNISGLPKGIYLLGFENGRREKIVKN